MRLARVITAHDQCDPTVAQLVSSAELDVLQLDYRWRRRWDAALDMPRLGYATGLLKQLRSLHQAMYLDPRLRVLSHAGGDDALACIEEISRFLAQQGSAELLITLVRGDNLLPRLEELFASGIELSNIDTGMRLQEVRRPLIAAQVEIGAGPLATALAEGSRLVVAGCCDPAAPFIAAAVNELGWSWDKYDALASAATAARIYKKDVNRECDPSTLPPVIELDATGRLQCSLPPASECDLTRSCEQLQRSRYLDHADVSCDLSALRLRPDQGNSFSLDGIAGSASSDDWRVRIKYDAGYLASAMFRLRGTNAFKLRGEVAEVLRKWQRGTHSQGHQVENTCEDLGAHVVAHCSSDQLEICDEFIAIVKNLAAQYDDSEVELDIWRQRYAQDFWARIPRDAVDISVDTRPAKQWE